MNVGRGVLVFLGVFEGLGVTVETGVFVGGGIGVSVGGMFGVSVRMGIGVDVGGVPVTVGVGVDVSVGVGLEKGVHVLVGVNDGLPGWLVIVNEIEVLVGVGVLLGPVMGITSAGVALSHGTGEAKKNKGGCVGVKKSLANAS